MDYSHYLPSLFEGLCDDGNIALLAGQAIKELLEQKGAGDRIVAAVPLLVLPVTRSLQTRNPAIVCRTLLAFQHLIRSDPRVGPKLVPFFRHFLPAMMLLKTLGASLEFKYNRDAKKHFNAGRKGDQIEYGQRKKENLDDLVEQTLRLLEKSAGKNALAAIKVRLNGVNGKKTG